ncbi:MAG: hypothetical protein AABY88_10130 [Pseudomonadota bacterium]
MTLNANILPDFTSPQGRASAKFLTQWNARFATCFGTPLLSMQGRLLMLVAERVSMPQSEAERCLPIAHRTFYNMLSDLKDAKLLIVETDITDGRLRRLRLGETFGPKSGDP